MQAELRQQINENNRKLAERNFAEQFVSARAEAENAALRIRQIGASITDAEKNISASLARYQAGEAQINEVTDAQNILTILRTALYQAIYDYQIAKKRLLQAVGK
jgi:outer membrane protein TolC